MDGKGERRKLKLMNEVLPAPMTEGPGTPRHRTLQHLQKLLAVAAGGASAAQVGCNNNTTHPNDPTVDIPGTTVSVTAPPSASAIAQIPPKATATAPPEDSSMIGYGVVDPMPPPAVCPGISQTIQATAVWKSDKGVLSVEVKLGKSNRSDVHYNTGEPPSAWGGRLANVKVSTDAVSMTVTPDSASAGVGIRVATLCNQGPSHINVSLGASQPKAGTPIAASMSDSY